MTDLATTDMDEPDGGFVVWFDPNGDPCVVFHANEDDDPGTDRWFSVDGESGMSDPLTWADLAAEMTGLDGPYELVRAA